MWRGLLVFNDWGHGEKLPFAQSNCPPASRKNREKRGTPVWIAQSEWI